MNGSLQLSQSFFQQVVEASADAMTVTDREGAILFQNSAAKEFFRRTLVVEEYQIPLRSLTEKVLRGEADALEFQVTALNGSRLWVETRATPLRDDDGRVNAVVAVTRDITSRCLAAKQLQQSLAVTSATVEATADGLLVVDTQGKIISFNRRFMELWRIPDEVVVSRADDQALSFVLSQLQDPESFLKKVRDLYAHPEAASHDMLQFKDGRIFERYSHPLHVEGKNEGRVWCFRDVTERKRNEAALRASEARFRAMVNSAPELVKLMDAECRLIDINPAGLDIIEAESLAQVQGANTANLVMPDYRDAYRAGVGEVFRGKAIQQQFEIVGLKGSRRWVELQAVPLWDEQTPGKVKQMLAVTRDLTWRKQTEQKLRERDALLQKLSEQVPGVIYQYQQFPDGRRCFPYASEGIRSIYEVTPEQVRNSADAVFRVLHPDDLERVAEGIRKSAETLSPWHCVYRVNLPTRGLRWLEGDSIPERLDDGSVLWHGYIRDVTDRKRSEEAVQASEGKYRRLTEGLNDLVYRADPKTLTATFVNKAIEQIYGYTVTEWLVNPHIWLESIHKDDKDRVIQHVTTARRQGQDGSVQYRIVAKDGQERWVTDSFSWERDENGEITSLNGVLSDVTDRIRTEEALRASEERFSYALDATKDGLWDCNLKTGEVYFSPQWERLLGFEPKEVPRRVEAFFALVHPDDVDRTKSVLEAHLKGLTPTKELEVRLRTKSGEYLWFNDRGKLVLRDEAGNPARIVGTITDITERKKAEAALYSSEQRLRTIFDTEPECVKLLSPEGLLLEMNPAGLRMIEADSFAQVANQCVYPLVVEQNRSAFRELTENVFRGESGMMEFQIVGLKGTHRWWETHVSPLRDTTGVITAALAITRDITARKAAEDERLRTLETLQLFINSVPAYVSFVDANQRYQLVNGYYEEWFERKRSEIIGRRLADLHPAATYEDMRPFVEQALAGQAVRYERCITGLDQQKHWFDIRYIPRTAQNGKVAGFFALVFEITDRKHAEETLRQSQKLEAIGRLAGGVAHDFNNLLTTMMLHADLAGTPEYLPAETLEALAAIRGAAQRAADLTRQLLLFSRRQVIQPRYVNLNEAVTNLVKLLERTLGDDIHTQLNLSSSPLITFVDAGMLDQVIMNLAVNSRDAMPTGGQLSIETTDVTLSEADAAEIPEALAGHYVCLSVTDTGCGISPENLSRIFEPFFTTKEPGKGTGLGLATVFGIVKQHDGFIRVHSTVGKGTTFRIFLPAKGNPADAAIAEIIRRKPAGGSETILVVEDDPSVRKVTCRLLEQQGYRILKAANGVEALRIWQERKEPIHLLFTDLTMPEGISGRELCTRMRESDPMLKVIFTSGHSAEFAGRELNLQEGQNYLQKPSSSHQLLQTVRRCLDE